MRIVKFTFIHVNLINVSTKQRDSSLGTLTECNIQLLSCTVELIIEAYAIVLA